MLAQEMRCGKAIRRLILLRSRMHVTTGTDEGGGRWWNGRMELLTGLVLLALLCFISKGDTVQPPPRGDRHPKSGPFWVTGRKPNPYLWRRGAYIGMRVRNVIRAGAAVLGECISALRILPFLPLVWACIVSELPSTHLDSSFVQVKCRFKSLQFVRGSSLSCCNLPTTIPFAIPSSYANRLIAAQLNERRRQNLACSRCGMRNSRANSSASRSS